MTSYLHNLASSISRFHLSPLQQPHRIRCHYYRSFQSRTPARSNPSIKVARDSFTVSDDDEVTVVSWNILGPMHGESEKHVYAAKRDTRWSERKERILSEILKLKADVLCLQEASMLATTGFFIPRLQQNCSDKSALGCAIFVKCKKLEILQARRVYLKNLAGGVLERSKNQQLVNDVTSKWHSVALAHLQLKSTGQTLVVGNTHLFWNPARPDIKAVQTYSVISALRAFSLEHFQARPQGISSLRDAQPPLAVLLCGDMNSGPFSSRTSPQQEQHPRSSSAVFELLKTGVLLESHPEHPDTVARTNKHETPHPELGEICFPRLSDGADSKFIFSNIYELDAFSEYQPLFTSKTQDFQGWIDHIWINESVEVRQVLVPPVLKAKCANIMSQDQLDECGDSDDFLPIPNKQYPSDHIPIGCKISIRK